MQNNLQIFTKFRFISFVILYLSLTLCKKLKTKYNKYDKSMKCKNINVVSIMKKVYFYIFKNNHS